MRYWIVWQMLKLCTHYFISMLSVSHQSITWTTNVEDLGETGQAQNCREGDWKASGVRSCKTDRETWSLELGGRKTKIIQSWSLELKDRWKGHKDVSGGKLNLDNEPWENPGTSRARRQALGSSKQKKWSKKVWKLKMQWEVWFWSGKESRKAKGVSKKSLHYKKATFQPGVWHVKLEAFTIYIHFLIFFFGGYQQSTFSEIVLMTPCRYKAI